MRTTFVACAMFVSFAALALVDESAASAASTHYKRLCDEGSLPGGRRCHAWILADESDVPIRAAAPSGLGAADLEAAYHLPVTGGSGRIIASVLGVHYPNAEADLAVYRQQYGLPPCTKANGCFIQVDANGGTNFPAAGTCNGVAGESALDIQMLSAGCPDCSIMLIEPNGQSDTQAITMAVRKGAVGLSFSFCGSESGALREASAWNHPGTGLFASSGDWGYLSHEVGPPNVCSPASFAGVVSVGGTTLMKSTAPRGWTEQVWSHAGSGCSTEIPKPAWQTDTGCKMRMVSDLSAIAENVANYCTDPGGRGGWGTVGGTSASSPFVAGALAVTGVLDGNFNPSWVWQHANEFYDITSGNNGTCGGASSYYCQATAGFDGPTGVGTPNGDMLRGGSDGGVVVVDAGTDGTARDAARDAAGSPDASSGGAGGASTSGTGGSNVGGSSSSSTTVATTSATTGGIAGSSATMGTGGGAGTGASSRRPTIPGATDDGGCSCRLDSSSRDRRGGALFFAASLLFATGLRRKRRA
jgi:hypothetical protein